jgi:hypothetical protein
LIDQTAKQGRDSEPIKAYNENPKLIGSISKSNCKYYERGQTKEILTKEQNNLLRLLIMQLI